MSLEDPFFVVKDEVFKALNKTRGLYLRWRELGENCNSAEAEWTTNELRNSLRSIEWDLEDLEDTINILFEQQNTYFFFFCKISIAFNVGVCKNDAIYRNGKNVEYM
ncbi:Syntaxin-10 [Lucilia cuprina]|nr:Syntaxin-10 [Lucilia cuprina]